MLRRPPRSTLSSSSAASDVYKRQVQGTRGAGTSPGPEKAHRARDQQQVGRDRDEVRNKADDRPIRTSQQQSQRHADAAECRRGGMALRLLLAGADGPVVSLVPD